MNKQLPSLRSKIDLMTEQELAAHLKICRRQLYTWRMSGIIPYLKIGKAVRFRAADVANALEKMRVG
jgi:excisionase family DNA binding protein